MKGQSQGEILGSCPFMFLLYSPGEDVARIDDAILSKVSISIVTKEYVYEYQSTIHRLNIYFKHPFL